MSLLNQACKLGLTRLVKELLDAKAPINHYAIAYASDNSHIEIVKMLEDYSNKDKGESNATRNTK